MQKLARNTDLHGMGLPFAPTQPAPGPPMPGLPSALPGVPLGQANPSTFLLLVNMFDPETEEEQVQREGEGERERDKDGDRERQRQRQRQN